MTMSWSAVERKATRNSDTPSRFSLHYGNSTHDALKSPCHDSQWRLTRSMDTCRFEANGSPTCQGHDPTFSGCRKLLVSVSDHPGDKTVPGAGGLSPATTLPGVTVRHQIDLILKERIRLSCDRATSFITPTKAVSTRPSPGQECKQARARPSMGSFGD